MESTKATGIIVEYSRRQFGIHETENTIGGMDKETITYK